MEKTEKKNRFNRISDSLPSSIKMKLEHIKRYLNQNKASVMVGAGFSKNAEMDESISMKDWKALGVEFYKKLYNSEPSLEKLIFNNPIRLASQVEASFGRNHLDSFLLDVLPDDRIMPSKLHTSLLKLRWKDVYTTNYDTLLERASFDSGRYYKVVSNKETLLYEDSPRIVKLHGSFPSQRPFIITEEDYRSYPKKFPEFVNTVRQSLIESVFCLIGFSGEDPNFLHWLGWLRDVMGDELSPVYWITFEDNLHESSSKLLAKRGIDLINLKEISDLSDYEEALDFLFDYLINEVKVEWSGEMKKTNFFSINDKSFASESEIYRLKTLDDAEETISVMKRIRESYPGWITLPLESCFEDTKRFLSLKKLIEDLDEKIKLRFIGELDWRLDITLTNKTYSFYIQTLEELTNKEYKKRDEKEIKVKLMLSLLSIYRQRREDKNFEKITKDLEKLKLNGKQKRRFYYEQSLRKLAKLDYKGTKEILKKWNGLSNDYIDFLWKSSILSELGQRSEALRLIEDGLRIINSSLLKDSQSEYLKSCRVAFLNALFLYKGQSLTEEEGHQCLENKYQVNAFLRELESDVNIKIKNKEYSHGFSLKSTVIDENEKFSNNVEQIKNIYRFLLYKERRGIPLAFPAFEMDCKAFNLVLPLMIKNNFNYCLSILIRTSSSQLIDACMTREIIRDISRKKADNLFDEFFLILEEVFKEKSKNEEYIERYLQTIIPLLSRLSTKLSEDKICKLCKKCIAIYRLYAELYKPEYLKIIYDNLNHSQIIEILPVLYKFPVLKKDIVFPDQTNIPYEVNKGDITVIDAAFKNDDISVQIAGMHRLLALSKYEIGSQNDRLKQIIIDWRCQEDYIARSNQKEKEQLLLSYKLCSYDLVPYNEEQDKTNPKDLFEYYYEEFVTFFNQNGIDDIRSLVLKLRDLFLFYFLKVESKKDLSKEVLEILKQCNKKVSEKNTGCNLSSMKSYVILFYFISIYVKKLLNKESSYYEEIYKVLEENHQKGFPSLSIMAIIIVNREKKESLCDFKKNIYQILILNRRELINDACKALLLLQKKGHDVSEIISKVLNIIEFSQTFYVDIYIDLIIRLLQDNLLKEDQQIHILSILKNLYDRIKNDSFSEEFKADIYFEANKLAGLLSNKYPNREEIILWRKLSEDEETFNDIRQGFYIGQKMNIDNKKSQST